MEEHNRPNHAGLITSIGDSLKITLGLVFTFGILIFLWLMLRRAFPKG